MTQRYYDAYWSHSAPPEKDPLTPERRRLFVAEARRRGAVRVLDAGCGAGAVTASLASAGFQAEGVDISETAIDAARRAHPAIPFHAATPEASLPHGDGTFDAVFCAEVIEHIYDSRAFLRELARVLRPNGLLFLTTPYHGLAKNLAIAALRFEKHFDPSGPHIRFFTDRSLLGLLAECGFAADGIRHCGRWRPFWMDTIVFASRNS